MILTMNMIIKKGIGDAFGIADTSSTFLHTSNIFTRYNVNGFVEELPQLPEDRNGHACAALPATGVRTVQPTF